MKKKEIILLIVAIALLVVLILLRKDKKIPAGQPTPKPDEVKTVFTSFPVDDTSEYEYTMTAQLKNIDGIIENLTIKVKDKPKLRKGYGKEETFFRYDNVHDDFTDGYVLYIDDNKVKIYDGRTREIYITNVPTKYDNYDLITCEYKVLGIEYYNNNDMSKMKTSFISYKDGALLYDKKYNSIEALSCNVIKGINYVTRPANPKYPNGNLDNVTTKTDLISPSEEKVYKTISKKDKKKQYIDIWIDSIYNENGEYFIVENNSGVVRYNVLEILAFNGTEIKSLEYAIEELGYVELERYVYINEDGTLTYRDEPSGLTNIINIEANIIRQIDDEDQSND